MMKTFLTTAATICILTTVPALAQQPQPRPQAPQVGDTIDRDDLLRRLVSMLYARNDHDFQRGTFRVRGDVVEVIPQYENDKALRASDDVLSHIHLSLGIVIGARTTTLALSPGRPI